MPQLLLSVALLSPLLFQQTPPPAPEPNGDSGGPSISDDGKWIVFESRASNFVAGDVKDTWDVFLYERGSGTVTRVNQDTTSAARSPQISGDGRFVVFLQAVAARSAPSEPGESSTEHPWEVVLHDRQEGSTLRLGECEPTYELGDAPAAPSISRDGARVVFSAISEGTCGLRLYESQTVEPRVTELVVGPPGLKFDVSQPSISRSGRYLAFSTARRGLAAPAPLPSDLRVGYDFLGHETHVYRRDLETGANASVSDFAFLAIGYAEFSHPVVSDDGRYVAYDHNDDRLMGVTHAAFVTDLEKSEAGRLVTIEEDWWDGTISVTWLASDGRHVLVESGSHRIPAMPADCTHIQVVLRTMEPPRWELVSKATDGNAANANCWHGVASADLSVVAYSSDATNLVLGDTNRSSDVFLFERANGRTSRIVPNAHLSRASAAPTPTQPNGESSGAQISSDGQFLVFASRASNFDDEDVGDSWDIFLASEQDGGIRRLSLESHGMVSAPAISADGRWVAYWSQTRSEDSSAPWTLRMLERPSGKWTIVEGLEPFLFGNRFLGPGPSISDDGGRIAFQAKGPLRPDGSGVLVAKHYDRTLGISSIASLDGSGELNDSPVQTVVISGDGRKVAFSCQTTKLASWPLALAAKRMPGPNESNVFLRDLEQGTTRAVNDLLATIGSRRSCYDPLLSADGKQVLFEMEGEPGGFFADLEKGVVRPVLPPLMQGEPARGHVSNLWLARSGQSVLVSARGEDIPGSKPTHFPQLYLHNLSGSVWTSISRSSTGEPANRPIEQAAATRDLSKVVFESEADNLVEGDTNNARDIFIADVATGQITRIEAAAK